MHEPLRLMLFEVAFDPNIREQDGFAIATSSKRHSQEMTHGAARAVTPQQVIATDLFGPRSVKPNIVKVRQLNAPVIHPNKAVMRNIKIKEPAETLTAEEKYAYDQLMLALSITGSTLRIVKDKIDGIEEKNAVLEKTK